VCSSDSFIAPLVFLPYIKKDFNLSIHYIPLYDAKVSEISSVFVRLSLILIETY
jgi:hypothetical protein